MACLRHSRINSSLFSQYFILTYKHFLPRIFLKFNEHSLSYIGNNMRKLDFYCSGSRNIPFKLLNSFYSINSKNAHGSDSVHKGGGNEKPQKPKKEIKTYITLLDLDNNISVTTVEDAKKLAERRNYKLVKVENFDPKTNRAVYKLMTGSQYLRSDWEDSKIKKDKSVKGDKLVSLSSNTNENDVLTKVKMMKKWLTKQFEVKVVITGDFKSGENIYKIIEREIGSEGRILQKRTKGSDIRFQIMFPKKKEAKENENAAEK